MTCTLEGAGGRAAGFNTRKQEIQGNKKLDFHFYTLYIHNLYYF